MDSKVIFKPLHIRAYLQTPVISDRCLPLDGIIFNHFVRDKMGAKTHTLARQSTVPDFSGFNLPFLKRNTNEPDWYYACSFAVWPEHTKRDKHEYAKRFDFQEAIDRVDFQGKRGKVETSRGEYKNYFVKEYTWNCMYIDWYCRGVKSEIENLLSFCTHVGKKSSQGCGSVLRWEVNETDRDWWKRNDKGLLMRAIPSKSGLLTYGIRPSYWHPHHQALIVGPD
jgi:CRISPR type IV-associated protein Csf3